MLEHVILLSFVMCRKNILRSLLNAVPHALRNIVSVYFFLIVMVRRAFKGHVMSVKSISGGYRDKLRLQREDLLLVRLQSVVHGRVPRLLE